MTATNKDIIAHILEQYDQNIIDLADLKNREVDLLTELTREAGLVVHSIVGEVTERDSLLQTCKNVYHTHQDLNNINDLVKIRITVFFEDEVEKVAKIVNKEFKINHAHIIDQGPDLDPDRFGYSARHYQTELLDSRIKLIEYRRFEGFKTQIQILSVLQQAWAEIADRLNNPDKDSFPKDRRRAFTRVAGLLELADEQFNEIKTFIQPLKEPTRTTLTAEDERSWVEKSTEDGVKSAATNTESETILAHDSVTEENPGSFAIEEAESSTLNRDELANFIITNPLVNSLDRQIQEIYNAPLQYQEVVIDRLLDSVGYFQFTSIDRLEEEIEKRKSISLKLATHIFGDPSEEHYDFIPVGISISLFFFVLVASTGNKELISQYTNTYSFLNDEANEEVSQQLSSWYKLALK